MPDLTSIINDKEIPAPANSAGASSVLAKYRNPFDNYSTPTGDTALEKAISFQNAISDIGYEDPLHITEKDYESYKSHDVVFNRKATKADLDEQRAKNESTAAQWAKLIGRTANELVTGTVVGFADMGAIAYNLLESFINKTPLTFDNQVSDFAHSIKDSIDEWMPIYRENPEKAFDVSDLSWWTEQFPSIASTVSLMLPAYGASKAISAAGKGLGKITRGARLAAKINSKLGEGETRILNDFGKALVQGGTSRTIENFQEARQTQKDTRDYVLRELANMTDTQREQFFANNEEFANKPDSEIAEIISTEAAQNTFAFDFVNTAFDVMQFYTIGKMLKARPDISRPLSRTIKANKNAIKYFGETQAQVAEHLGQRSFGKKAIEKVGDFFKDSLSLARTEWTEGIEEAINYIAQKNGNYIASSYFEKDKDGNILPKSDKDIVSWSNLAEIIKYVPDAHMWEQFAWGVAGGMVFGGIGNKFYERKLAKENKDAVNQQESEIYGRADILRKYKATLDMIDRGINPYLAADKQNENNITPNSAESKTLRAIARREAIDNLILEAKHQGNEELLSDFMNDKETQRQMAEKMEFSEEEVVAIVSDFNSSLQQTNKNYDNAFKRYRANGADLETARLLAAEKTNILNIANRWNEVETQDNNVLNEELSHYSSDPNIGIAATNATNAVYNSLQANLENEIVQVQTNAAIPQYQKIAQLKVLNKKLNALKKLFNVENYREEKIIVDGKEVSRVERDNSDFERINKINNSLAQAIVNHANSAFMKQYYSEEGTIVDTEAKAEVKAVKKLSDVGRQKAILNAYSDIQSLIEDASTGKRENTSTKTYHSPNEIYNYIENGNKGSLTEEEIKLIDKAIDVINSEDEDGSLYSNVINWLENKQREIEDSAEQSTTSGITAEEIEEETEEEIEKAEVEEESSSTEETADDSSTGGESVIESEEEKVATETPETVEEISSETVEEKPKDIYDALSEKYNTDREFLISVVNKYQEDARLDNALYRILKRDKVLVSNAGVISVDETKNTPEYIAQVTDILCSILNIKNARSTEAFVKNKIIAITNSQRLSSEVTQRTSAVGENTAPLSLFISLRNAAYMRIMEEQNDMILKQIQAFLESAITAKVKLGDTNINVFEVVGDKAYTSAEAIFTYIQSLQNKLGRQSGVTEQFATILDHLTFELIKDYAYNKNDKVKVNGVTYTVEFVDKETLGQIDFAKNDFLAAHQMLTLAKSRQHSGNLIALDFGFDANNEEEANAEAQKNYEEFQTLTPDEELDVEYGKNFVTIFHNGKRLGVAAAPRYDFATNTFVDINHYWRYDISPEALNTFDSEIFNAFNKYLSNLLDNDKTSVDLWKLLESKYTNNNNAVNLKDIEDLFKSLGLDNFIQYPNSTPSNSEKEEAYQHFYNVIKHTFNKKIGDDGVAIDATPQDTLTDWFLHLLNGYQQFKAIADKEINAKLKVKDLSYGFLNNAGMSNNDSNTIADALPEYNAEVNRLGVVDAMRGNVRYEGVDTVPAPDISGLNTGQVVMSIPNSTYRRHVQVYPSELSSNFKTSLSNTFRSLLEDFYKNRTNDNYERIVSFISSVFNGGRIKKSISAGLIFNNTARIGYILRDNDIFINLGKENRNINIKATGGMRTSLNGKETGQNIDSIMKVFDRILNEAGNKMSISELLFTSTADNYFLKHKDGKLVVENLDAAHNGMYDSYQDFLVKTGAVRIKLNKANPGVTRNAFIPTGAYMRIYVDVTNSTETVDVESDANNTMLSYRIGTSGPKIITPQNIIDGIFNNAQVFNPRVGLESFFKNDKYALNVIRRYKAIGVLPKEIYVSYETPTTENGNIIEAENNNGKITLYFNNIANEDRRTTLDRFVRIIIHEQLHSKIAEYKLGEDINSRIKDVYDQFEEYVNNLPSDNNLAKFLANKTDAYLEEFVVESLTNKELATALNDIKYKGTKTKAKNKFGSLFSRLLSIIKDLFGINLNEDSLLRELNEIYKDFSARREGLSAKSNANTAIDNNANVVVEEESTNTTNDDEDDGFFDTFSAIGETNSVEEYHPISSYERTMNDQRGSQFARLLATGDVSYTCW